MPTDKKRVMLTPDPAVLAVLGIDAGQDETVNAWTLSAQLRRYAVLIERAAAELSAVLTRADWNYLAAVLGGPDDIYDHADAGLSPLVRLCAEAEDGHRLTREGDHWYLDRSGVGEDLPSRAERAAADGRVSELLAHLRSLTPLHAEAILAAVRWFWQHDGIDHTADEWWAVGFRRGRAG